MSTYEELLQDAIDLHCHVDLEFSQTAFRKREPEWHWLPKAEALGIRGVVLKSHWWPTAVAVPYIQQLYSGPVSLWSSITLNPIAGGPELWAVEAAAAMGARVVWLPTWSARQDLEGGGFHQRVAEAFGTLRPEALAGHAFLDQDGHLTLRGRELLDYCHRHALTLASGHVSWKETLAFSAEARSIGFERLIFTHPLAAAVQAPLEAAKRAAELGAWIELCWTNIAPGRMAPADAVAWIRQVGLEHVVVSTDYFRQANPSPPELFRLLLGTLYDAGLSADEIRTVASVNPALALGLDRFPPVRSPQSVAT